MKPLLATLVLGLLAGTLFGYPLDGWEATGIDRLQGYALAQQGKINGPRLPAGALLPLAAVRLRLQDRPQLRLPDADPELTTAIAELLGEDAEHYSISLLDLSHADRPTLGELHGARNFNPGSLGKILIAVGLLQALADRFPEDLGARQALLRERLITANQFIRNDHHKVPFWAPEQERIRFRRIRIGDRANLYSWLDWMLSPSSNAAAAMVLREYLLMARFGPEYPVSETTADDFFRHTKKRQLATLLHDSLQRPLTRNGLDPEVLRQGGFFTRRGKELVPGGSSRATTHSLLSLLLKIEQGTLIDPFSSLELKRLLYLTEKRIRYASHPDMHRVAFYFKSGSFYSCVPEENFVCKKYQGNKQNLLNSVAIVEGLEEDLPLHYLVVVSSNVLRKNAAFEHQKLALKIHRLLQKRFREGEKLRNGAAESGRRAAQSGG